MSYPDSDGYETAQDYEKYEMEKPLQDDDETALFKERYAIRLLSTSEYTIPPLEFINTIENKTLKKSHNFCMLLWLMNDGATLTYEFRVCDRPFQMFKNRLRENNRCSYQECLYVLPAAYADATAESTLTDDQAAYKVSIFPQILQFTTLDKFKMDSLLLSYTRQFHHILQSYLSQKPPLHAVYLRANLSRLLQSYVNDTFYDIVAKWNSWTRIVCEPTHLKQLSALIGKFWSSYLIVQIDGSLAQFAEQLDRGNCTPSTEGQPTCLTSPQLRYGIWVDANNGILLFCNNALDGQSQSTPTLGITLGPQCTEATVQKLLLFVNMCLLECCSLELR